MEGHGVTRLARPLHHLEPVRFVVGIWYRLEAAAMGRVVVAVEASHGGPADRMDGILPEVGPADQTEGGLRRYRVQRDPDADRLRAVNEVVGSVAVPRGRAGGAWLLDQHVLVEQLHGLGSHQAGGHVGNARTKGEPLKLGDTRPVAVVVPEASDVASGAVVVEELAGVGLVTGYSGGQVIDPVSKQALEVDGAIDGERVGHLVGNGKGGCVVDHRGRIRRLIFAMLGKCGR